eukprot:GFUD01009183.1.p2 GENE.GFUD01009183.1~~GFUD01009183.1.p2  ORF type:complete len:146 (-),score=36.34 GFUD01009183.1:731-1168(-)
MNELCEKFPDTQFVILAFPSNQFGHQENSDGQEIVNALKHVRPGNGFEFKGELFDKIQVNGKNELPLFTFLKERLPTPSDDPVHLMGNPQLIIWSPVKRTDIAWNFEKFLISPEGIPIKRYSRTFPAEDIAGDIQKYGNLHKLWH